MTPSVISVDSLTKSFGSIKAIDDISFNIKKNSVVGFLGPNGAGKTTTMRILTCFLAPDSGDITIGGYNALEEPEKVKKIIGYLPENNPLYVNMTVEDYLTFIAKIKGVRDIKSALEEQSRVCGLKDVIKREISTLSKGYKQRVGLAQALISDPEILILDEPTAGLDPSQIVEIRNLIKEVGKEKTVLLCSHILPEVSATCDEAIIINKGKIAAAGPLDELQAGFTGLDNILLTFKGNEKRLKTALGKLPDIKDISNEKPHYTGAHTIRIQAEGDAEIEEKVFRAVIREKCVILELYREKHGLEDIFMKLTQEVE